MLAVSKHSLTGLAIHLSGFALGFISEALVLQGVIGIESGIAVLVPFADLLYGLGLVIVVAIAARAGVPLKYLVIAGAIIGTGLFYKSAVHEIHVASSLGFSLPHPIHVEIGTIKEFLFEVISLRGLKSPLKNKNFLASHTPLILNLFKEPI